MNLTEEPVNSPEDVSRSCSAPPRIAELADKMNKQSSSSSHCVFYDVVSVVFQQLHDGVLG